MRWPFAAKSELPLDPPEKSESPSRRFAFRLFRQLAGEPNARNIFFSPASVMLCLWPLYDGATAETREAMAKVLEVAGLEPKEVQSLVGALRSALQIESPGLKLEAANSLWCSQLFSPRSEYIAEVRKDYGAEVFALDFGGDRAVATINAWVEEKTHGKIGSILSSLDPLTFLVAINAVYFKDSWSKPFMSEFTREESFYTSEGRKLRVPLMSQFGLFLLRGLQGPGRVSPVQDVTIGHVCLPAGQEVEPARLSVGSECRGMGQVDAKVRSNERSHSPSPLQADISGDAEPPPFTAWDGASLRSATCPIRCHLPAAPGHLD